LWIRVHVKELNEVDIEPRLLEGFAGGCLLGGFADLDKATGDGPPEWGIPAPHEHHRVGRELDHYVGRGTWSPLRHDRNE
jgi:hypothetical protein